MIEEKSLTETEIENANTTNDKHEEMQNSRIPLQVKQDIIQWRRTQALTLYAAGKTMTQIADILKVDVSTISRDIAYLREESTEKQSEYIEQELPFRHRLRVSNMDKAIAELWSLYEKEIETKTKKSILDSITDALIKQATLDGNPIAIENALKTITKIKKLQSEIQERQEQDLHEEIIV